MNIDPRNIYRLKGTVQHYPWGGYDYIPQLLGMENPARKPFAEYWLGAHTSAPSQLVDGDNHLPLDAVLKQSRALSGNTGTTGQLPYLLKVLDVREMLSIQVHPAKEAAEKGFDAEEEKGVHIQSPQRKYKDRNHKPEVMIALSDFWLLHGFKPAKALRETLIAIPQFRSLATVFDEGGCEGLYRHVMELPEKETDAMLLPVVQKEIRRRSFHEVEKNDPGYWVAEYYLNKDTQHIDKGIFSVYFFNLVHLHAGQAIFQGPGVPHAYLQGQNIELMANSDNVLRGGLTTKHVDIAELLQQVRFESIRPEVLAGDVSGNERLFRFPIDDFFAGSISLQRGEAYTGKATSPEIFICMKGAAVAGAQNTIDVAKGEAFVVFPGNEYSITANQNTLLFRAAVP